jgi:hypothetical protein
MIRLSIAVVLLAVVLGLYGLIVGISSIAQGSFMGIGSVIMVVVGTFMVLAVLLLAVIGLTVTQGIFTERQQLLDGVSVWRYVDDSGA